MNDELISILVPMYNSEKYIYDCITSILNQTYKNFELIVLDDGSKDNSNKIVSEMAKTDSRIKLYRKENEKSVSITRNKLLKMINAKYFIFIDSDDMVSPLFLELLYKALKETNSDISYCDFTLNKNGYTRKNKLRKLYALNNKQSLIEIIRGKKSYVVWNKLIKTELIKNGIQFYQDLNFGEDYLFTIDLYSQKSTTCFIKNKLYFYRLSRNSISRNGFTESKKKFLEKLIELENDAKYKNVQSILTSWICLTSCFYLTMIKFKKGYKEYKKYLKENIAVRYNNIKGNKDISLMYRFFIRFTILVEGIKIRR